MGLFSRGNNRPTINGDQRNHGRAPEPPEPVFDEPLVEDEGLVEQASPSASSASRPGAAGSAEARVPESTVPPAAERASTPPPVNPEPTPTAIE
ncbi:MAG TPA: hypothetical protein VHF58_01285, partial [Solirubrobacterales bacterium]|nr:hypothetical protein [Solirubrobacterales bacterium]